MCKNYNQRHLLVFSDGKCIMIRFSANADREDRDSAMNYVNSPLFSGCRSQRLRCCMLLKCCAFLIMREMPAVMQMLHFSLCEKCQQLAIDKMARRGPRPPHTLSSQPKKCMGPALMRPGISVFSAVSVASRALGATLDVCCVQWPDVAHDRLPFLPSSLFIFLFLFLHFHVHVHVHVHISPHLQIHISTSPNTSPFPEMLMLMLALYAITCPDRPSAIPIK